MQPLIGGTQHMQLLRHWTIVLSTFARWCLCLDDVFFFFGQVFKLATVECSSLTPRWTGLLLRLKSVSQPPTIVRFSSFVFRAVGLILTT